MLIAEPRPDVFPRFAGPSDTSWRDAIDRVAGAVGGCDSRDLQQALTTGELVPSGQIWRGAGVPDSVLYNCFVTAPERGETADHVAARITDWTSRGSGVGVNLSSLAEDEDSFLRVVHTIGKSQQQLWDHGCRRTATMISIGPEIPVSTAATMLAESAELRHLNLAVHVTDAWMGAAAVAIRTGQESSELTALRKIARSAWATGNPGLVFTDRVNDQHPFDETVVACNPCAEQHLLPNEGCNLASLNLAAFVRTSRFDEERFRAAVRLSVRFLDAIIDQSAFPSAEAAAMTRRRRRIGLGVLGFATALIDFEIPYASADAVGLAERVGHIMKEEATRESRALAASKGPFADVSTAMTVQPQRNSYLLSIAPTGAISLIWSVSTGIEPILAPSYKKEDGTVVDLRNRGHLAEEVSWQRQLQVLAAWQKHTDGGISKTVIVPRDASPDDVLRVILTAWDMQCKSISVFRTDSRAAAIRTFV